MTVSLDTASAKNGGSGTITAMSWSHTCASSANGLLVAIGATNAGVGGTGAKGGSSSVSYGGVAMSSVTSTGFNNSFTTSYVDLWYLANPTVGANTVSVAYANTVRSCGLAASLIGVSGSSTLGAPSTRTAKSATASINSIAANGVSDCVIAALACADGGNSISLSVSAAGQTLSAWTKVGNGSSYPVEGLDTAQASGTSNSMSINLSTSADWVMAAVAALAGGAPPAGPSGGAAYFYRRTRRM